MQRDDYLLARAARKIVWHSRIAAVAEAGLTVSVES